MLLFAHDCSTLLSIRNLYCWVLSKGVSSTIFKVFGMMLPGIEPRSPGPLANTLPSRPMSGISSKPKLGPERCPVYLKLLWIGNTYMELLEKIKRFVNRCFNAVKLCVILKSYILFPTNIKYSGTIFQKSFLIYKFSFKCDVCYIGRTTQRLYIRIHRHILSRKLQSIEQSNFTLCRCFSFIG